MANIICWQLCPFLNGLVPEKKVKYSRHYMLAFPLFLEVTSADSYSSMKEIFPTFCVRSSFFPATLKLTGMKQDGVEEIAYIICYLSTGKPFIKYIISYKGYCEELCQHIFSFSNGLVPETKKNVIEEFQRQIFQYCGR